APARDVHDCVSAAAQSRGAGPSGLGCARRAHSSASLRPLTMSSTACRPPLNRAAPALRVSAAPAALIRRPPCARSRCPRLRVGRRSIARRRPFGSRLRAPRSFALEYVLDAVLEAGVVVLRQAQRLGARRAVQLYYRLRHLVSLPARELVLREPDGEVAMLAHPALPLELVHVVP